MVFRKQIIIFFQIILLIFCCTISLAQSGVEADSLLARASELTYSKPSLAEKVAKMVYENDNAPEKKIEALFILSQIDYQRTNYKSSLAHLYSIEDLMKNVNDKDKWSIELNFYLAKIYRDLQILDLSEKHFYQANKTFQSLNNSNKSLKGIYNYENALHQSQNQNYKKSNLSFKKNLNDSLSVGMNFLNLSFLGLGQNYIETNQPDSAFIYFSRIPEELEILYARSLLRMAQAALQKNDRNASEMYLRNSLNPNHEPVVLRETFNIFSQKYLNSGEIEQHEFYKLKYDSIDKRINSNLDQAKNFVIKHIEEQNQSAENDENSFWTRGIFIIICLIILLGIPVIYYYFKTKSDYRKYLQIVKEINVKTVIQNEIEPKEKQSIIPEKSEQLLLKKLEKFEHSENYLNNKISLTTLAKQLDTNTKYLSELVNKNKGKNFNSYINELRINYILKKLKDEQKYRNYKVTSLAEECGYTSHSTFIAAFRSVTGISPASFINFLRKEKNQ